jgi:non-ribosomal peptide synthase protein (TIGR01720 family)
LPPAEQSPAVEAAAVALQTSLDLSAGPLLQVALFTLGAGDPGRLLVLVHHLAVDAVSWRFLLEDLYTAYRQLGAGGPVQFPPRTTSYLHWARSLAEHARSEGMLRELDYWRTAVAEPVPPVPVDCPEGRERNTVGSARTVTAALEPEETRFLLQDLPAAWHVEINDVLLTALAQAFARWGGGRALLLDLEGHGREPLFEDVDLSRTVGWFTSLFPVRLDLGPPAEVGQELARVKEQLGHIPGRGLGYGLLRYLNEEAGRELAALPQPEVVFLYLGRLDQALPDPSLLRPARETCGPLASPAGRRTHLLEVHAFVTGGRLEVRWTHGEYVHRRATVERLGRYFLDALRGLIGHCRCGGNVAPAAPDPAAFGWGQADVERITGAIARALEGGDS